MISYRQNICTLNMGGIERTLKFSMSTMELYIKYKEKSQKSEISTDNILENEIDFNNPFTAVKILFWCALIVANKTKSLKFEQVSEWIDECEDERFDAVYEKAQDMMGFLLSVEESALNRQVIQMKILKEMGVDTNQMLGKALSSKS
jgi:hypothetical protein